MNMCKVESRMSFDAAVACRQLLPTLIWCRCCFMACRKQPPACIISMQAWRSDFLAFRNQFVSATPKSPSISDRECRERSVVAEWGWGRPQHQTSGQCCCMAGDWQLPSTTLTLNYVPMVEPLVA